MAKRRSVLVVDDDAAMREMLVSLLEDEGLRAEDCAGAETALDRLLDRGLIAEARRRPTGDAGQEKRRFYAVTALGRRAAAAEADLMTSMVARSKGLRGAMKTA